MKPLFRLAWGVAVLAVALSGAWLATSSAVRAAGQDQRPLRIAVVNVPRVVTELREWRDIEEKANAERAQLAGEEAKMKEQIKNLESQAGNFRPDSPQY